MPFLHINPIIKGSLQQQTATYVGTNDIVVTRVHCITKVLLRFLIVDSESYSLTEKYAYPRLAVTLGLYDAQCYRRVNTVLGGTMSKWICLLAEKMSSLNYSEPSL